MDCHITQREPNCRSPCLTCLSCRASIECSKHRTISTDTVDFLWVTPVPSLRRLETAGLVRKKKPIGSSKRPRHWFQLSAAGRKLARAGWIPLLKDQPPSDFDAVLRLADMAQHYRLDMRI